MSLNFNPSEKRYDIQGLPEDKQKKGIKGYTGLEGRIRAFFSNAIAVKLDKNKTVYLNRESSRNFYGRIVNKYPQLKNDKIKWNKDKDVKSFIQNCCNYVKQRQTVNFSTMQNQRRDDSYESAEESFSVSESSENESRVEKSDHTDSVSQNDCHYKEPL